MRQGDRLTRPSSRKKHDAALAAAEVQFLATGFESVTMDSIAKESGVAKQTLYSYFGSKQELFLALVTEKTRVTSRSVLSSVPRVTDAATARDEVRDLLVAQLTAVMNPEVLALRRLVIGEAVRFPELARALYENGPRVAITSLATVIGDLVDLGLVRIAGPDADGSPDADTAATQLNWLVMGDPVNRAMLLGDDAIPTSAQLRAHVDAALDLFFAAYGA
ncbi:TetR/AcrR family transcriptional regulator [Promicromonospora sp. CA-289599]|uniref:TetR/AcrR family transcriptional regulator n=1 Tax=Promicromonospora sp. CA-289599 TaxID=3240014 RepID=UPI003D929EE0